MLKAALGSVWSRMAEDYISLADAWSATGGHRARRAGGGDYGGLTGPGIVYITGPKIDAVE